MYFGSPLGLAIKFQFRGLMNKTILFGRHFFLCEEQFLVRL